MRGGSGSPRTTPTPGSDPPKLSTDPQEYWRVPLHHDTVSSVWWLWSHSIRWGSHGIDLDSRAHHSTEPALEGRPVDRGNRPADRRDQKRGGRQGASTAADAAPVTAEAKAGPADPEGGEAQGAGVLGPELLVADRPSRRQGLPFLRRTARPGQALLHRARTDGLHPAEELERRLIILGRRAATVVLFSSSDEPRHQPSS